MSHQSANIPVELRELTDAVARQEASASPSAAVGAPPGWRAAPPQKKAAAVPQNIVTLTQHGVEAAGSPGPLASDAHPGSSLREALQGGGLRLTLLLSGAQLMLERRRSSGERMGEDELEFLDAVDKQFAALRGALVDHAINDAAALLSSDRFMGQVRLTSEQEPQDVETIVLLFLRNYLGLAQRTLAARGPDAALAMFDPDDRVRDPLSILTCVFDGLAALAENQVKLADTSKPMIAGLVNELRRRVLRA